MNYQKAPMDTAQIEFIFKSGFYPGTLTCQIIMQQILSFSGKKTPTQPY